MKHVFLTTNIRNYFEISKFKDNKRYKTFFDYYL